MFLPPEMHKNIICIPLPSNKTDRGVNNSLSFSLFPLCFCIVSHCSPRGAMMVWLKIQLAYVSPPIYATYCLCVDLEDYLSPQCPIQMLTMLSRSCGRHRGIILRGHSENQRPVWIWRGNDEMLRA